jgi:ATP-dependent Clp protease, protease subunit
MPLPHPALSAPTVRLSGSVGEGMLAKLLDSIAAAREGTAPFVLELTTSGGDADVAGRMALEIRLLREIDGKDAWFFGKTFVYSAGVTVMGAFPVDRRVLSADSVLLLHERRLEKQLHLSGALRASLAQVRDVLAELESGQRLERDNFADLVRGSDLVLEDLMQKVAESNWYVSAEEARSLRLVGHLV